MSDWKQYGYIWIWRRLLIVRCPFCNRLTIGYYPNYENLKWQWSWCSCPPNDDWGPVA